MASYSEELSKWCVSEKRVGDHVGTQPLTAAFICGRSLSIALFVSELQVGPARKRGYFILLTMTWASTMALVVKNPAVNAGYVRGVGSVPGLGRSPGGGHGNPLQYSCLEIPMERRTNSFAFTGC